MGLLADIFTHAIVAEGVRGDAVLHPGDDTVRYAADRPPAAPSPPPPPASPPSPAHPTPASWSMPHFEKPPHWGEHHDAIRGKFESALQPGRFDGDDASRSRYASAATAAISRFSPGMASHVASNLGGVTLHPSMDRVGDHYRRVAADPANPNLPMPQGALGAFVLRDSAGKKTHLVADWGHDDREGPSGADAWGSPGPGPHQGRYGGYGATSRTAEDLYAHELHHVADHGRQFSRTPAWESAWEREHLPRSRLSSYATRSPTEGFAEFGRMMHSGMPRDEIARRFPESHRLYSHYESLPPGAGDRDAPSAEHGHSPEFEAEDNVWPRGLAEAGIRRPGDEKDDWGSV